eukprot:gb/GECG01010167.1/.p1 GENE.gb/GECG01010167.1/~~gb/GECG01010167.1/.p1  ORF type:complete len:160 (+),score=6.22 gb/GECG01010167.1/:1-480(+)
MAMIRSPAIHAMTLPELFFQCAYMHADVMTVDSVEQVPSPATQCVATPESVGIVDCSDRNGCKRNACITVFVRVPHPTGLPAKYVEGRNEMQERSSDVLGTHGHPHLALLACCRSSCNLTTAFPFLHNQWIHNRSEDCISVFDAPIVETVDTEAILADC